MMKHVIFTGALLLATAMTGEAMASCIWSGGWSRVQDIVALLTNNGQPLGMTVCSSAGQGTQEEHHADFELWDYKCGDPGYTNPPSVTNCPKPDTDRRKKLGNWSVVNNNVYGLSRVKYTYSAFTPPTVTAEYRVFVKGNKIDFCGAGNGPSLAGEFTLVPTTPGSRACPP